VCVCVVCVCVCSGCTPSYMDVYQCGLWIIVQVCLCGDGKFLLTWLWGVVGLGGAAGVRGGRLRRCGLCVCVCVCVGDQVSASAR